MGATSLQSLGLFTGEAALVAGVTLALFRLRFAFGLAPVLVMLGMLQPLQVLLASTVYAELFPGVTASPGSAVLFTWTLMVVLLIYVREGASEARKAIYGIVAANFTAVGLYLLVAHQASWGESLLPGSSESFTTHARIMFTGTVMLALDTILVVVAYECVGRLIRRPATLRMAIALLAGLAIDTLGFGLGAFLGTRELVPFMLGSFAAKSTFALFYAAVIAIYFRLAESKAIASENWPLRDVFHVLTFREKYERERARSAASEARRAAILDVAQDAILAVDANGLVVECNLSAERVFGRTRQEIIGQSFSESLVHQSESLGISGHATGESPVSSRPIAVTGLHKDGSTFDAEALVAHSNGDELESLFVIALRDVTERKQLWENLAQTQRLDTVGSLGGASLTISITSSRSSWETRRSCPRS